MQIIDCRVDDERGYSSGAQLQPAWSTTIDLTVRADDEADLQRLQQMLNTGGEYELGRDLPAPEFQGCRLLGRVLIVEFSLNDS